MGAWRGKQIHKHTRREIKEINLKGGRQIAVFSRDYNANRDGWRDIEIDG